MRRAVLVVLTVLAAVALGCGESDEATARVSPTFFGVAPQSATSDADIARMQAGNVGSYHLLLLWPRVEQQKGVYDWRTYDALIGKLAATGIKPIPYVYGTPAWLTKDPAIPPTKSSEGMKDFKAFLAAAAERYGPGGSFWDTFALTNPGVKAQPLRQWEIWNEVNSGNFWYPKPNPSDYAKLLRLSAKTLHKAEPTAQVMTAGMFATPKNPQALTSFDYLKKLFRKRGVRKAVDLVGVHPYGPRVDDVERQITKTRKIMRKEGVGKAGTWVTEIGWGSDTGAHSQLVVSPKKQARLLTKTYDMMLAKRKAWKLGGVLWYTWRDSAAANSLCTWCSSAGLLDQDLDAKPAWFAFTDLTGGNPE